MPAIPNPLIIYSGKSIHTDVTNPLANIIKGRKNKESIMTVFTTMVVLAFLLVLLFLKCVFTRFLKVLEKSEFISLENFGLLILLFVMPCIQTNTTAIWLLNY
jgi:hypothetical protein